MKQKIKEFRTKSVEELRTLVNDSKTSAVDKAAARTVIAEKLAEEYPTIIACQEGLAAKKITKKEYDLLVEPLRKATPPEATDESAGKSAAEMKKEEKEAEKKKKAEAKAKEKAEKEAKKKPGVIQTIQNFLTANKGQTRETVLAHLVKEFPDRDADKMKKTVSAQIGSAKRPCRMERERGIEFIVEDKSEGEGEKTKTVRYFNGVK